MSQVTQAVVVALLGQAAPGEMANEASRPEQPAEVGHREQLAAADSDEAREQPAEVGERGQSVADEVREIQVPTRAGKKRTVEFAHAGARNVIDGERAQEEGATSVGDAIARIPGVHAFAGNAGVGSTSTKLNFAARGVNPRFSSRSTVLLDGVPIAAAPYGQPQLSLFPVSLFSVRAIDVMRGGAPLQYGPQTAGGVVDLLSAPIPTQPTVRVMARADRWGDIGLGAAYAGTHRGLGVHVEYAPRFGQSYRSHSELAVHGGLVKLQHDLGRHAKTATTVHYFFEEANIPGGISRVSYEDDPLGSDRPLDRFEGWRIGVSNRIDIPSMGEDEAGVSTFYNHSERASAIANGPLGVADALRTQPRVLDTVGVEPHYRVVDSRDDVVNELLVGTRGVVESASILVLTEPVGASGPQRLELESDDLLLGWGTYIQDSLHLLDSRFVLSAGVRAEVVSLDESSSRDPEPIEGTYWAPLPMASIWVRAAKPLAVFAAYRRSFAAPQFLQVAVAPAGTDVRPETADTVETGLKLRELGGLTGEATVWLQSYRDLVDVGLASYTEIGDTRAYGVDSELVWNAAVLSERLSGLSVRGGYAAMLGRVVSGPFEGNDLPWFPPYSISGGLVFEGSTVRLVADVVHHAAQLTDYANTVVEPPDGAVGRVDRHTLLDLAATALIPLPGPTKVRFTLGVSNVLGVQWFLRTDDRNRGILPMAPRTFHATLVVQHVGARRR